MEIAKTAAGNWLRNQAIEVLSQLGIKDPNAVAGPSVENPSPRVERLEPALLQHVAKKRLTVKKRW
jgi:hypothetical protein